MAPVIMYDRMPLHFSSSTLIFSPALGFSRNVVSTQLLYGCHRRPPKTQQTESEISIIATCISSTQTCYVEITVAQNISRTLYFFMDVIPVILHIHNSDIDYQVFTHPKTGAERSATPIRARCEGSLPVHTGKRCRSNHP